MNTLIETEEKPAALLQIAELVLRGVDSFTEAGRLIAAQLDAGVDVYGILPTLTTRPISLKLLRMLEDVGRGKLHPQLLLDNRPGARMARKLPFSDQKKLVEEKVEMVVETAEGTDVLMVDALALPREQAQQVIAFDHLRPAGEQKAFRAAGQDAGKASTTPILRGAGWEVLPGRKVHFKDCVLNLKGLLKVVAELQR